VTKTCRMGGVTGGKCDERGGKEVGAAMIPVVDEGVEVRDGTQFGGRKASRTVIQGTRRGKTKGRGGNIKCARAS